MLTPYQCALLVAGLLSLFILFSFLVRVRAFEEPTLQYDAQLEQPFTVDFPGGGQIAFCTVYTSLTETIEREGVRVPYAPRHGGMLAYGTYQLKYFDDWAYIEPTGQAWDVQAELYAEVAGQDDLVTTKTNIVRVIH